MRKILMTSALPYANGDIHLGHLVGYIQADIWKRFQNLHGNQCLYMCADDTHGTPIMLSAEQAGVDPEQYIQQFQTRHLQDFNDFNIEFDHYYTTHSKENTELSQSIFLALKDKQVLTKKTIDQWFDPIKQMFLSDRYVIGSCPKCGAEDQYGDNCEVCGATYDALELNNPRSKLSDSQPEIKQSEHYFFKLSEVADVIENWLAKNTTESSIANKLQEWLQSGLQDWNISRDAPYFGIPIPDEDNKFFYVWLDAPIGYMATFLHYCQTKNPSIDFDAYWRQDDTTELYHFIGKDIINFHSLFWPAMLYCSGYRLPTKIHVNGFLTIESKKMSKSKGTFILASDFTKTGIHPDTLRYYFASKLSSKPTDIDLEIDHFVQKINSDLVGKLINIGSRCSSFVIKLNGGKLATNVDLGPLQAAVSIAPYIAENYEHCEYATLIKQVMQVADVCNRYLSNTEPWKLAKNPDTVDKAIQICSMALNVYYRLTCYLAPIMPELAKNMVAQLGQTVALPTEQDTPIQGEIKQFKTVITKLDTEKITKQLLEKN